MKYLCCFIRQSSLKLTCKVCPLMGVHHVHHCKLIDGYQEISDINVRPSWCPLAVGTLQIGENQGVINMNERITVKCPYCKRDIIKHDVPEGRSIVCCDTYEESCKKFFVVRVERLYEVNTYKIQGDGW